MGRGPNVWFLVAAAVWAVVTIPQCGAVGIDHLGPPPTVGDDPLPVGKPPARADTHDYTLSPLIKEAESLDRYLKTEKLTDDGLKQVQRQLKVLQGRSALSTGDSASRNLLSAKLDQLDADVKVSRAKLAESKAKALEDKLKHDLKSVRGAKAAPTDLSEGTSPPPPPESANPLPKHLGNAPAVEATKNGAAVDGTGGPSSGDLPASEAEGAKNGGDGAAAAAAAAAAAGAGGAGANGDGTGIGASGGAGNGGGGDGAEFDALLNGDGSNNGTANGTLGEDIEKILNAERDEMPGNSNTTALDSKDNRKCKKPVKDDSCDEPMGVDTHIDPSKTEEVLEGLHEGLEQLPGDSFNDTSAGENAAGREESEAEDEEGRLNRILKHLEDGEHWDQVARDKAREVLVQSSSVLAAKLEEGELKEKEDETEAAELMKKAKDDRDKAVDEKKDLCKYKFKACAMKCSEAMCHSNCEEVHNPCHAACEVKKEPPSPKCKHECIKEKHHCKKKCHKKSLDICDNKHLAETVANVTASNATANNGTQAANATASATEVVDQNGAAKGMMELNEETTPASNTKRDLMDYFQAMMDDETMEMDETALESSCPQEPSCKKQCKKCHSHCKEHTKKCKKKCKPTKKKECHQQCQDLKDKCKESKCKKQVELTQQVCVDTCIQAKYLCFAEAMAVPWNALGIVNPGSAFPAAQAVIDSNPHINQTAHQLGNPLANFFKASSPDMQNLTISVPSADHRMPPFPKPSGKDADKDEAEIVREKEEEEINSQIDRQKKSDEEKLEKGKKNGGAAESAEEQGPCKLSPIDLKAKGPKVEKSGQLYPFTQAYESHPDRTYRIESGKMIIELSDVTSILTTPLKVKAPLVRVEIHTPSAHMENGRRYDAEVVFVHEKKNDDDTAQYFMVSEFVEGGIEAGDSGRSRILDQLISEVEGIEKMGSQHPFTVDTAAMIPSSSGQGYYFYEGSMMGEPCEPSKWYVLTEVQRVTNDEIDFLKTTIGAGPSLKPQPLGDRMQYIDYEPDANEEKLNTEELKAEDKEKDIEVKKAAESLGAKGIRALDAIKRHENGTESDQDLEKELQDLANVAGAANQTDAASKESDAYWSEGKNGIHGRNGTDHLAKELSAEDEVKLASIEDPEERDKVREALMHGKTFEEAMGHVALVPSEEFARMRDASKPVAVTKDCDARPDEPRCKNLDLANPEIIPRDEPLTPQEAEDKENGGHAIPRTKYDHVHIISEHDEEKLEDEKATMHPAPTKDGRDPGQGSQQDLPPGSIKTTSSEPQQPKLVRVSQAGHALNQDGIGTKDEDLPGFETKCTGQNPDDKCKITPNIEEGPSVMTVPQGELESTNSIGGTKVHAAGPQAEATTEEKVTPGGENNTEGLAPEMSERVKVDPGDLEDAAEMQREDAYLSCGGCSGNTVCDHTSGKCVALN